MGEKREPLGLKQEWYSDRVNTAVLGEITVTKSEKSGSAQPNTTEYTVYAPLVVPGDFNRTQALERMNIHQLRDLRTLLNHILGEEAS